MSHGRSVIALAACVLACALAGSSAWASAYSDLVENENGLVGYWRLGELTGTALADATGSNTAGVWGASLGAPGAVAGDSNTAGPSDAIGAAQAPQSLAEAIRFTYDDNGRLTGVSDPASWAASYRWDKSGNLLSIASEAASEVQILQLNPTQGPVGTEVRILGTGFSPTEEDNTVEFNGTQAAVESATAREIVATVPAGATDGEVSVTTPTGTATSPAPFQVAPSRVPAISDASPRIAGTGDAVTVTGSNFEPEPGANAVRLNNSWADVTSESVSSLGIAVPPQTGSGRLSITTPEGTATGPDIFIPPADFEPADVGTTARTQIDEAKTVSTSTGGKVALVAFDADAGQRVSLEMTGITYSSGCVTMFKPDNTRILDRTCFAGWAGGVVEPPVNLPTAGTYTVLVEPGANSTGSGTIKVHHIPHDVTDIIVPSAAGDTKSLTTTIPGQSGRLTFSGQQGDRVLVKVSSITYPEQARVSLIAPDGATIAGPEYLCCPNRALDAVTLPADGTYTILVDPPGATTGTIALTAYAVPPDATYTLEPTPTGDAETITTTVPGQNAKVTFDGTSGQRISLHATDANYSPPSSTAIELRKPDGTTLNTGGYMDAVALPDDGTYTVAINPEGAATGSLKLTAWSVPDDATDSLTPTAAGDQGSVTTTAPGQNAAFSFNGTAGQRVFARVDSETYPNWASLSLRKPNGSSEEFTNALQAGTTAGPVTLPADGTYSFYVDPSHSATGNIALTVFDVPPDATANVTPSAAGAQATVATTVPGQNGQVTLNGTAGQRISFNVTGKTYPHWVYLLVRKPDGSTLREYGNLTNVPYFGEPFTLPADGTYAISLDPDGDTTGSLTMDVYDVPADATDTLAFNSTGDGTTLTTSTPGQGAALTFVATEGQEAAIDITAFSCAAAVISIKKPNGETLTSEHRTGTGTMQPITLPATGQYTIAIKPSGATTGSISLTLTDVSGQQLASNRRTDRQPPGRERQAPKRETTSPRGRKVETASFPLLIESKDPRAADSRRARVASPPVKPLLVRAPSIPNFELRLPAGTQFRDRSNRPLGTLDVSRGRGARPALPIPQGRGRDALYLTFKPRGAKLSKGAQLVYPNALGARPGRRLHLWTYNERQRKWASYGGGVVTGDGKQVLPRPNDRLTQLTATAISTAPPRRERPPAAHRGNASHDRHDHTRSNSGRRAKAANTSAKPGAGQASTASLAVGTASRLRRIFKPQGSLTWRPGQRDRRGTWLARRGKTPWAGLPGLQAGDGETALAGQALRLDGTPLAGVRLEVEHTDATARTDRTGRFLLTGLTRGHHVLVVDGRQAARRKERYGEYEIGVDLARGQTIELEQPIWMTALDPAGDAKIASPSKDERVLRSQRIPGLEIHIPKGSVIRDRDGRTVRKLNLTQVPVDRPPFPLPSFIEVPTYFTVQPGGAYLSKGARILYPNYSDLPPGQRVKFWQYDPDDRGWHVYGRGTVSENGRQVVPDRGVRVWELTGAMISTDPAPPDTGPNPFETSEDGDPVDLGTGLFVYRKLDLHMPDTIPIALQRTYRQGDENSYAFGRGMTNAYDLRLHAIESYQEAALILPDGGRIKYVRTSSGTGFQDAVYKASNALGYWQDSTLRWAGNDWELETLSGTTYVFGKFRPLIAIRNRFGEQLTITRDPAGPITRITSPNGRRVSFSYDGANRVTEARDHIGRTVTYDYTPDGWLSDVTDPEGRTTHFAYDSDNVFDSTVLTEVTDGRGITYLENTYDDIGVGFPVVTEQTLADGGTYTFEWTPWLHSIGGGIHIFRGMTEAKVTDPRGTVHTVNREWATDTGALFAAWESWSRDGQAKLFEFERSPGTGRLTAITDPLERRTTFAYDSRGNVIERRDLAGTTEERVSSWSYHPQYNLATSYTDPLEHTTHYRRDDLGRLTSVEDATGREWAFYYQGHAPQPMSVTDPAGKTTELSHVAGQLSSVRDPLGNETNVFFDAAGRPIGSKDPLGRRTRWSFDRTNLLKRITAPDGGQTQLDYDGNGNLTDVRDPRNGTWSATYDTMDRPATETDPLGQTSSYNWDADGNLIEATDRRGKVSTFQYDAFDRPTFAGFDMTGQPGSEQYDSTVDYTWDAGDRLTEADDSEGGTFTRSYDDLDRLLSETGPEGTVSYTYDDADRPTTMDVPGQATTNYAFDDADRLTGITRGGLSVAVGHDQVGRRSSVTLPNGVEQALEWDDASRLERISYTQAQTNIGELEYEYDASGQRTAVWGSLARVGFPQPMGSATYNAANRRTEQDGTTLTYDDEGNLTSDGNATYAWDARNQLASYTEQAQTTTFGYDPFGRRTRKTAAGQPKTYLHDGPNTVQEKTGGDVSADLLAGLAMDDLFARTTPGGTDSYLRDALGSTLALTNGAGATQTSYTYEPFGETTTSGAPSDNPYQYTGRENDGNGLYQYRARYYSPGMKRFISEDPIGLAGGDINLQTYVGNGPLNYVDPTGLIDITPNLDLTPDFIDNPVDTLTDQAQESMEYYADLANDSDSVFIDGFAYGGGMLSSLATRKNLPATTATLAGGGAAQGGLRLFRRGWEWKPSPNFRLAPFGNRRGHPTGRWPHYHRRGAGPGQGMGRHRPWDRSLPHDRTWRDRF